MAATEPTGDYVKEITEAARQQFAKLHESIRDNRKLRDGEYPIDIPDAYETSGKEVRTPIVADMLLRVVSTLTTEDPQIVCDPWADTEKAKKNSSLRERFETAKRTRQENEIGRPVYRMGMDEAVADGIGVWKETYRLDAWKGEPKRKKINEDEEEAAKEYNGKVEKFRKGAPFPLIWQDVDPTTYMYVSDGLGVQETIEETQRPLLPAMKALRVRYTASDWSKGQFEKLKAAEPFPMDVSLPSQTVSCVEHWDKEYVTYMLNDEKVYSIRHGYGRPPYFHFAGHSTSRREYEKQYLSVIAPFKHLIPTLERLLTMAMNWSYLTGWPFLVQDGDSPYANQQQPGPTPPGPETIKTLKPGTLLRGVRFLEAPSAGKDLMKLVDIIRMMIDRSGLASVVYGQGSGISSGYMASQLITAAQLVYRPILQNAQMAYQQMIQHSWKLIENRIKQTVYVSGSGGQQGIREWLALGPEDIDKYYVVDVKIDPLLPMDEIAQRASAQQMTGGQPIWSVYNALSETGHPAPEEEIARMLAEEGLRDPQLRQALIQQAMIKKGLIEPPKPQPLLPPPAPVLLDQFGNPMPPGPPMGVPPNAMGGPMPPIPGLGMPLPDGGPPPLPVNAGLPPVPAQGGRPAGVERLPGGPQLR